MYELEEEIYFVVLIAIPIIVLAFVLLLFWRRHKQKQFANHDLLLRLSPEKSMFKSSLKIVLWSLAITCIAIGLVNPKFGTKLETVKREGVDIVFAVDVSKSMLAEDIAPNRLDKSKQLVTQIINNLASDRVGIIAYAGQAYPQLPITTDYAAAKMFLQNMNTDMLSSQGTAIADAIEMATTYFNDEEQTNRILCIISDGEDHESQNINLSSIVGDTGITIFTIGVGSISGAPIPIKENNIIKSYKKDENGEVVITKLNEKILSEMALESNGKYFKGDNTNTVVNLIIDELKEMDKKEFESKQFVAFKDQFQWFLGFGLFFLFLDLIVYDKKTFWIERLNLFNENGNKN